MSNFPDYPLATNKAYEVLELLRIRNIPIDVAGALKHFRNLRVYSYRNFCLKNNISEFELLSMGVSNYGFTFRGRYKTIILYNQNQDEYIIRFTLAHELGHIFLLHTEENDKNNREANCFARNFLCPVPVITRWKLSDPYDYVDIFNVSPPMAEVSANLYINDLHNITKKNYLAVYNLFSLQTLTKEKQLLKYNARYQRCLADFAGLYR